MPHKRVEKRTLERVEADIAQTKASIQRIKNLGAFGPDSKEIIVQFLRDCTEASAGRRDDILRQLGLGQVGPDVQHAVTWAAAQENAYKNILELFTEPKRALGYYEDDLKRFELERESYAALEQPRK